MAFFSRFFPTSRQRKFQEILSNAEKRIEKEIKPLRDLSLLIITSSVNCCDLVTELITADDDKVRTTQRMITLYEFIYFFVHMAMREAFASMLETQIKHLQNHLGPIVASAAVDSYVHHWPKELKDKMIAEFFENLDQAEVEYAECSQFDSPRPSEGRVTDILDALFTHLGERVACVIERPLCFPLVANIAIRQFNRMNLGQCIENFKQDSMSLTAIPYFPKP